ncbi:MULTISPECIES: superoxide dismutase family protein [unclassified Marinobacter]|uniref:superoxide dismutase family protein n=1 Tax=unclassified Marinobacter TaxID=83889 RepID=UPI0026E443A9|nr:MULTISPECIES: superoxide dismutase family protein [unclassified Marinobacter]MDO6441764.1 superoxide dismutase family protein [Marinobacter sp. 2_MG-2023]MDO6824851.1 superoxide dismutase family protein [Marinobacter sp. 1_MG-2023]
MKFILCSVALAGFCLSVEVHSGEKTESAIGDAGNRSKTVTMKHATASGPSEVSGTIRIVENDKGIVLTPNLKGLSPGLHGFHLHENGNCGPTEEEAEIGTSLDAVAGGKAGEHYDPGLTETHSGPYGDGHLGDLPNLYFNDKELATHPVYAPRLTLRDLPNRALVIHANPDNYSDDPKNGGSGRIVACGVVD